MARMAPTTQQMRHRAPLAFLAGQRCGQASARATLRAAAARLARWRLLPLQALFCPPPCSTASASLFSLAFSASDI